MHRYGNKLQYGANNGFEQIGLYSRFTGTYKIAFYKDILIRSKGRSSVATLLVKAEVKCDILRKVYVGAY